MAKRVKRAKPVKRRRAKPVKRRPENLSDAGKIAKEDREIATAGGVATLIEQMKTLIARVDVMEKEVASMTAMANRWKGVTIALLGIGSFGGWLLAAWGKFKGAF